MKTILILIVVGNWGGVSLEKFRYPTEAHCQKVAIQMNETPISYGTATAYCISNGDGDPK